MKTSNYRVLFFATFSLLIIAVTALVTLTLKQQPEVQPDETTTVTGRGFAYVSSQLQLSLEQQEIYGKLVEQYRSTTRPLHQELNALQHEVGDELNKEAPDTTRIDQLSVTMGKVYGMLKKETSAHLLAVKKMCNPEQTALLGQLYSNMIDESAHRYKQGNGQRRGQGQGKGQGRQRNRHGQSHQE